MDHPGWRAILAVCGLALAACGPDSEKPSGTASDPVEVCEKSGQVCRFEGAKLGVCSWQADKLACTSQH